MFTNHLNHLNTVPSNEVYFQMDNSALLYIVIVVFGIP